nr:hypothetical protein [Tanacetum cinerariifolium]
DDVLPAEEQPLPATVSPTVESPGYITESKPEMEPEEEDGDDEKSEGQIRPALTIADRLRADDRLIGRLRRERRYFRTLSTTYVQEVAHSQDYCTQIMDYCQSPERQHIDDEDRLTRHIQHEHTQRDVAPEDGDKPSGDDADEEDEEQDEDDDEEEEEHPASADSIHGLSIVHCPRYEAEESSVAAAARPIEGRRADYGFVDSDIYGVMEDTQGRQTEIFQRVEALVDDSQYHYETGRLVNQEARCSREAWTHSIGLSSAVHFEL